MNRRDFFKFLGIGVATTAVAPSVIVNTTIAATKPSRWKLVGILPDGIKVPKGVLKAHERMRAMMDQQLGLEDLKNLQRKKRNEGFNV
jgi:hypothetical protein